MSTDQEYWDACLIKTWRNAGKIFDAADMFKSITGKELSKIEPPLLRMPPLGFPWKLQVRIFVANHLEKISKRLFEQSPDKDVLLLRKLKDSKYTTSNTSTLLPDKERDKEMKQYRRNLQVMELHTKKYKSRNQKTDWNVTK